MNELSKTQVLVAAKLNEAGPLSITNLGDWNHPNYCGAGEAPVRKALKEMLAAGLVTSTKQGRGTIWERTELPLPESMEARKERVAKEKAQRAIDSGEHGICQGCLRQIRLKSGVMVRHGWALISRWGGREGHHEGPCPGGSVAPISESRELAAKQLRDLYSLLTCSRDGLVRLISRPAQLSAAKDGEIVYYERTDEYMEKEPRRLWGESMQYEIILRQRVREQKIQIRNLEEGVRAFREAIVTHEPGHIVLDEIPTV